MNRQSVCDAVGGTFDFFTFYVMYGRSEVVEPQKSYSEFPSPFFGNFTVRRTKRRMACEVRRRRSERRSPFQRAADQRGEDGCKVEKEVRSLDEPSGRCFSAAPRLPAV